MISYTMLRNFISYSCLHVHVSQTTNFRLFQIERVCMQTARNHCGQRRKCNSSKKPLKIFSSQNTYWIALLFSIDSGLHNSFNPLPDMPILRSLNSAAKRDVISENMDGWEYNYLIE